MQDCQASHAAPVPTPPAETAPRRTGLRTLVAWLRDLALSALIAVVLVVFVYQPVKVEGTSMTPALKDQERIFINKFTYRFGLGNIERGDTVVFWYPLDPTKSYIKRVLGTPGDRIRIEAGQVYVNGRPLLEDYVVARDRVSWPSPPDSLRDRTVPPGMYFVLGDNRMFSSDSRSWGYVPRENIYGKAVFAYWPLDEAGRLK
jgi:signal peptidase I